jgi:hypothetical protein
VWSDDERRVRQGYVPHVLQGHDDHGLWGNNKPRLRRYDIGNHFYDDDDRPELRS